MATSVVDIDESQIEKRHEQQKSIVSAGGFPIKNVLGFAFLALMTIYFITPLYWLFIASTKGNGDLFSSFGLWIAHFDLIANLQELFTRQGGVYVQWLGNTVLYAVVGGAASTMVSVMAGYALAKYRFGGRSLVTSMVLGAALVPPTTLALPIYLLESKYGIVNTYWALLLPAILSPFGVFLARVYVNAAVPDDLLNAARIDGANEFRVFTRVALPILLPGMITIFLFQFVAIWNNFFLPLLVLSDPSLFPVNVGLATWNFDPAAHELLYNMIVTGSFVAVIPLILMFLFLQRYWRTGLSFGSLTG